MIFTLQLVSCSAMLGVIWLVQLLIYPAFLSLDPTRFKSAHESHARNISWVVAPLMILELLTALLLAWQHQIAFFHFNLLSVVFVWVWTFFVSVPIHDKISKNSGDHQHLVKKLIQSNWPRTFVWTIRAIALIAFISQET